MKNFKRTNYCGELSLDNEGQEVTLNGWVAKERNLGSLIFMDLRDTTGLVQIVIREEMEDIFEQATKIRNEFVIGVKGIVAERESKNPEMETGDIEIIVNDLKIFSKAKTPPIYIREDDNVSEELKLKYRYLDLRKRNQQEFLKVRAKATHAIRNFLDSENFLDIETPMLNKSTPEGARDYLVPSRVHKGEFYALPQSPQLMKQLLMIGGLDRYYQIAKCFRDEDLRRNRQPEFTQVDIEMSFVDEEDVMDLNERLLQSVFKEVKNIDLKIPFPRMTFHEAMERFGSDKPDLRFGFELIDFTDLVKNSEFRVFSGNTGEGSSVRGIAIGEYQEELSRRDVDDLETFAKGYGAKGLAWIRVKDGEVNSPIAKFLSEEELNGILEKSGNLDNNLILIIADKNDIVFETLAGLRGHLARKFDIIDREEYNFTWIVDFPLLEYSEEEDRYVAAHHPFTSPREEDLDLLATEPEKVIARAYDIVCNGEELGGGSIRIHDPQLQTEVFEALKISEEEMEEKFGFLVEALSYGTPPHGGLAYGLDRLVMELCQTENIRDVIAFPKTQSAQDLLTKAPSSVSETQLEELHIQIDGRE